MIKATDAICIVPEEDGKWMVGFFQDGRMHTRWRGVSQRSMKRELESVKLLAQLRGRDPSMWTVDQKEGAKVVTTTETLTIGVRDYYVDTVTYRLQPVHGEPSPEWARA